MTTPDRIQPVSYTHLDVYKRQDEMRSLLNEVVTINLGYRTFCGPENAYRNAQKPQMFLETYKKDDDSLLDFTMTGDETWVKYVNCETKKSIHGVGSYSLA